MHSTERLIFAIRHHKYLKQIDWLWKIVRPVYDRVSAVAGRRGLMRDINGTDKVRVAWWIRMHPEVYEPDVWQSLMSNVRPGDRIADVGAFVGIYTIALAKRVGPNGRVFAFEPDPINSATLEEHIKLNDVASTIEVIKAAVGAEEGHVQFVGNVSESHVVMGNNADLPVKDSYSVKCETLDSLFADAGLDILKIDVEGFEQEVLQGASRLLNDPERKPRVIYVEVHPYAWPAIGTTSESLLWTLQKCGYTVKFVDGGTVEKIEEYGEVVAYKNA